MQLDISQSCPEDLLMAAIMLEEAGIITTTEELLYFLSKPWKYKPELETLTAEIEKLTKNQEVAP